MKCLNWCRIYKHRKITYSMSNTFKISNYSHSRQRSKLQMKMNQDLRRSINYWVRKWKRQWHLPTRRSKFSTSRRMQRWLNSKLIQSLQSVIVAIKIHQISKNRKIYLSRILYCNRRVARRDHQAYLVECNNSGRLQITFWFKRTNRKINYKLATKTLPGKMRHSLMRVQQPILNWFSACTNSIKVTIHSLQQHH